MILLLKQYERAIGVISSITGFILGLYSFIQAWKTSPTVFTWLTAIIAFVLLCVSLGWVAFSWQTIQPQITTPFGLGISYRTPRYSKKWRWFARVILVLIFLSTLSAIYYIDRRSQELEDKVVILFTLIDGPDPKAYGITEQLLLNLTNELKNYDDTVIVNISEIITEQQGAEYARKIGEKHKADLVLWGWYNATSSDAFLVLHLENLSGLNPLSYLGSETHQFQFPIAELDSFRFQQRMGQDLTGLLLFISGLARYEAEDYAGAISRFDEIAIEENNKFIDASKIYYYRGSTNFHLHKFDDAINALTFAINLDPKFDLALKTRGSTYTVQGEIELALDDLNAVIELDLQADYVTYYDRGVAYMLANQFDSAIKDFSKSIELQGDFWGAYVGRGLVYSSMGQHDLAIIDLDRAIALAPEYSAFLYINRGVAHSTNGQYHRSIEDYNLALEFVPNDSSALLNRGNAYSALNQYEQAVEDYSQIIEQDPESGIAYRHRGYTYSSLEQFQLAIEDYSQAIAFGNGYYDVYYLRGEAYFALEQYQQAIDDFGRAISLVPEFADAYNRRGEAYFVLEQFDLSLENYEQALELNPRFIDALYNRATIYLLYGQYDLAIEEYEKLLQMDSENYEAMFFRWVAYGERGDFYLGQKNYELAIVDYDKAIELLPHLSTDPYFHRGKAYSEIGEYELAIESYTYAIEISPELAEIYYYRGYALLAMEDFQQAVEDFAHVIATSEDDWQLAAAYYFRGISYKYLDEYERAGEDLMAALSHCDGYEEICELAQGALTAILTAISGEKNNEEK